MLYKKNREINVKLLDLVLNDFKLNLIFDFVFKILRHVMIKKKRKSKLNFSRAIKTTEI